MSERRLLRAYVDETGDRGATSKSSPFFAFACVLVADEDEVHLRAAVSRLRRDLAVPPGRPLHWKDHVKSFPRRQHVARVLADVPLVQVVYVVVEKAAIPASATMRRDHAVFYNFAAAIVVERVLLAARDCPGGTRDAVIRFGHVKGFDHRTTTAYFDLRKRRDPPWTPWHLLRGGVHFDGQANWDGLQAADQYGGMLSVAIRPDQFGNYEPHHFLTVSHQIRRVDGRAWRYGFKFLGNDPTITTLPWWPSAGIE